MNLTKNILEYHFLHENLISHSLKDMVYLKLLKLKKKIKLHYTRPSDYNFLHWFLLTKRDKTRAYGIGVWSGRGGGVTTEACVWGRGRGFLLYICDIQYCICRSNFRSEQTIINCRLLPSDWQISSYLYTQTPRKYL